MPPRFIPIGGQGGFGGGSRGGGRFQPLGGGGAQRGGAQRQSRFIPLSHPRQFGPARQSNPHSPLPGIFRGAGSLASIGSLFAGSPNSLGGQALSGLGGLLNIGSGAATLAQGGNNLSKAQGATQIAGGGATLANALGADIPYVGPALALAGIGEGLAAGSQEGERAAVRAFLGAIPFAGPVFAATDFLTSLINMGLGEGGHQGDLSKAIMKAKQTALQQGAVTGVDTALTQAQGYPQILQVLSQIPPGTGQLQYGVGQDYTGETTLGGPALTQTPGWQQAITQAQQDPANFIKNFWVQTGQSGAPSFDTKLTRSWQTKMVQALPDGPLKTSLLDWLEGVPPIDPRGSDFAPADRAYQAWLTGGQQGLSPYQRTTTQARYDALLPKAQWLGWYGDQGDPEGARTLLSQINPLALKLGHTPFSSPRPSDPPEGTPTFTQG